MKRLVVLAALAALAGCGNNVEFKRADWDRDDLGKALPEKFLLGAATASHQVEGGNTNNDWWDWEHTAFPDGRFHVANGETSAEASGSWGHFTDRDLPVLKQLGANVYRLSVEWSRLEPNKGEWDAQAAQQYRDFIVALRANGIEPMVTLLHFTQPKWLAAKGGFENREAIDDFAAFTKKVAELLGDQVDLWCTINEPNVMVVQGWVDGIWPPGKQDSKLGAEVLANLLEAHARSAKALRETDTTDADGDGNATRIGIAHHVRVFQAATSSTLDNTITALTDDFFNASSLDSVATGRIHISVPGTVEIDREVPDLKGSFDFLGINYYTRDHVRADLADESLSNQYVPDSRPKNDLGWDIYPEGLYLFLKRFAAYGWPIYITENGIPTDATSEERPDYLKMHLYAVERAVKEGVDVRGYIHWSLIDNFEWAEGYEPRFGLFTVDYNDPNFRRCPTSGAETFRQIAGNLGLQPQPLQPCP